LQVKLNRFVIMATKRRYADSELDDQLMQDSMRTRQPQHNIATGNYPVRRSSEGDDGGSQQQGAGAGARGKGNFMQQRRATRGGRIIDGKKPSKGFHYTGGKYKGQTSGVADRDDFKNWDGMTDAERDKFRDKNAADYAAERARAIQAQRDAARIAREEAAKDRAIIRAEEKAQRERIKAEQDAAKNPEGDYNPDGTAEPKSPVAKPPTATGQATKTTPRPTAPAPATNPVVRPPKPSPTAMPAKPLPAKPAAPATTPPDGTTPAPKPAAPTPAPKPATGDQPPAAPAKPPMSDALRKEIDRRAAAKDKPTSLTPTGASAIAKGAGVQNNPKNDGGKTPAATPVDKPNSSFITDPKTGKKTPRPSSPAELARGRKMTADAMAKSKKYGNQTRDYSQPRRTQQYMNQGAGRGTGMAPVRKTGAQKRADYNNDPMRRFEGNKTMAEIEREGVKFRADERAKNNYDNLSQVDKDLNDAITKANKGKKKGYGWVKKAQDSTRKQEDAEALARLKERQKKKAKN
jgi:hypothetical protein